MIKDGNDPREVFVDEVEEKKGLVRSCRINSHKAKSWENVPAKDKRPGKGKIYSSRELEIANVLARMEKVGLGQEEVRNYRGIILDIIRFWPKFANKLISEGSVRREKIIDAVGRYWISVPWLILIIRRDYSELLSELNGERKEEDISDKEILANVSSIFSSIRNVLSLFNLVINQKKGRKNAIFYQFDKKLFDLSLSEMFFLFREGDALLKRIKTGKLSEDRRKIPTRREKQPNLPPIKIKTVIIDGVENIGNISISILPGGKIEISVTSK